MPRLRLPGGEVIHLPYDKGGGMGMSAQGGAPASAGIERLLEMLGDEDELMTTEPMPPDLRRREGA